ncbi:MAG: glycosyltransferase family 39 protein [Paludibacter sp.]|nr:glycosyltransferase family 39 protein [Paludibacter sp.]
MLSFFPQYFTKRAIILYFVSIFACLIIFTNQPMAWYNYVIGAVVVLLFFVGSYQFPLKWANFSSKTFSTNIFIISLLIRIVWVVFSYYFYSAINGNPFEFDVADSGNYDWQAQQLYEQGWGAYERIFAGVGFSDRGYPTFLGASYMVYGHNILIARLVKAVLSAFTAVLVYKLASRTFGESVGRMAGIFCMLMPELINICGLHTKETEMIFLVVFGIERADNAIRSHHLSFGNLVFPVLCAAALFTFRSVLGIGLLFAFITALFFSSARTGNYGKRMILGIWIVIAIAFLSGGKILTEIEQAWSSRQMNQEESMVWRSKRIGGNRFAVYGKTAIFAPAIFFIPIVSETNVPQRMLQLQNGGYYVKNLMAFFLVFALFLIVVDALKRGGKWRDFLLVGSFMIGYLGVIAMSGFAQSGRFHLPIIPFFLMFAAYGVSKSTNKVKIFYNVYMILLLAAIIVWNWVKLAGRDML